MKTTVDIPDESLRELMEFTKSHTKKAAIVQAVVEFNRRQRIARLARHAGTFKEYMTQDELHHLRAAE